MSLNTPQLIQDLTNIYDGTIGSNTDQATAKAEFIIKMATAIENYVKTAKVNYTGGLTAPSGAVAGTFNHTIE